MNLFNSRLSRLEERLMKNLKDTKMTFPHETQLIESGLALMWDLNQVTQEAIKDFVKKTKFVYQHKPLWKK